jgi:hypothetical protein
LIASTGNSRVILQPPWCEAALIAKFGDDDHAALAKSTALTMLVLILRSKSPPPTE